MLKMNYANSDMLPQHQISPVIHSDYLSLARLLLILTDIVAVALGFATAYWLRFELQIAVSRDVTPVLAEYVSLVAMLLPIWIALFALMRLYDFQTLLGGTSEYARAMNACTSGMMVVIILSFLLPEFVISRGWLIMSWLFSAIGVCSGRFFFRRIAYQMRYRGYFVTPALIVGTNEEAISLAQSLADSYSSGIKIIGFIDENSLEASPVPASTIYGLPVLGTLSSLEETMDKNGVNEVIIAATALSRRQLLETSQLLSVRPAITMRLSSGLFEIFTTGFSVTTKGAVPLLGMNRLRLDPLERTFKTALDYVLIIASAPLLVPLFLIISILIKLDSPGRIFYPRRVIGVGGKEFSAFKFRTMVTNGDEILARFPELQAELKLNHKLKDDPRITRVGKWLRRTSLDELPQLINVLLGQMSLVGPRMITAEETENYGAMQFNLLTVKPGLTGLWQVSGRSDLSYSERVQLDMYYIRNYNIWLDLQILFIQTIPAVLKTRGAY